MDGITAMYHNSSIVAKAVDRLKDAVKIGETVWLYNEKTGENFVIDSDTGFIWIQNLKEN